MDKEYKEKGKEASEIERLIASGKPDDVVYLMHRRRKKHVTILRVSSSKVSSVFSLSSLN